MTKLRKEKKEDDFHPQQQTEIEPVRGLNIAYIRVSTLDQHTERQKILIEQRAQKIDRIFEEKITGTHLDRPQLTLLKEFVRENDCLFVESFSRFSRNHKDLSSLLEFFFKKKVKVISLKENFDTTTPTGKLLFQFLLNLSEFEIDVLKQRQREGIQYARSNNRYTGRRPVKKPANWLTKFQQYETDKTYRFANLMKDTGLKRNTLSKFLREERENLKKEK